MPSRLFGSCKRAGLRLQRLRRFILYSSVLFAQHLFYYGAALCALLKRYSAGSSSIVSV